MKTVWMVNDAAAHVVMSLAGKTSLDPGSFNGRLRFSHKSQGLVKLQRNSYICDLQIPEACDVKRCCQKEAYRTSGERCQDMRSRDAFGP